MTHEQADAILDAVEAWEDLMETGGDHGELSGFAPGTPEWWKFQDERPARITQNRRQLADRIAKGIRAAFAAAMDPQLVPYTQEEIDQMTREGKFHPRKPIVPEPPTIETIEKGEDQ